MSEQQPGRRYAAIAVTVMVMTIVLALAGVSLRPSDGDGECPRTIMPAGERSTGDSPARALLIDVSSNAEDAADLVSRNLASFFEESLLAGARIEVVYDAGAGKALTWDSCFDGLRSFRVRSTSAARQRRDAEVARDAFEDWITQRITELSPTRTGGPLRLLQTAATIADGHPAEVAVLWSDFLPNADDCLAPAGETTQALIQELVQRCKEVGALRPLRELIIVGAGTGDRAVGHELWARDLASAVCVEIATRCSVR